MPAPCGEGEPDAKVGTKDAVALGMCLAACFGAVALGALFTGPAVSTWYQQIRKPAFPAPDWLFGPVWTTLYAMMAVAAWLVWRKGDMAGRNLALARLGASCGGPRSVVFPHT